MVRTQTAIKQKEAAYQSHASLPSAATQPHPRRSGSSYPRGQSKLANLSMVSILPSEGNANTSFFATQLNATGV